MVNRLYLQYNYDSSNLSFSKNKKIYFFFLLATSSEATKATLSSCLLVISSISKLLEISTCFATPAWI